MISCHDSLYGHHIPSGRMMATLGITSLAVGSCWDEDEDEDLVCSAEAMVELASVTLRSVLFEAVDSYGANA